eukprot:TRINITY_DN5651_c0_g1_i1.p2 TRINITY_DN5651_c0_g1~~TRINITY_DN5651_c0_g1_i1.p2  ORF type:complete len:118 (+),score=21.22 TRINITY_DN5651_c0_g1_i1:230-583(+)
MDNVKDQGDTVISVEDQSNENSKLTIKRIKTFESILALFSFSLSSIFMIVSNKFILHSFDGNHQEMLFMAQNIGVLIFIGISFTLGFTEIKKFDYNILIKFAPLNLLFLVMVISNYN